MTPDYTKLPYPVTGEWLYKWCVLEEISLYGVLDAPFRKEWFLLSESGQKLHEHLATLINTHIAEYEARLANCVEIPPQETWPEGAEGVLLAYTIDNNEAGAFSDTWGPIAFVPRKPSTLAERRAALIAKIDTMDADELAKLEEAGK